MSAFVHGQDHLDLLVTALARYEVTAYKPADPNNATLGVNKFFDGRLAGVEELNAAGQMLLDENIASYDHRYPGQAEADDVEDPPYVHRWLPLTAAALGHDPALVVLIAAKSYQYNACEHPGWDDSDAKRLTDALTANAITKLVGYDKAAAVGWTYRRP